MHFSQTLISFVQNIKPYTKYARYNFNFDTRFSPPLPLRFPFHSNLKRGKLGIVVRREEEKKRNFERKRKKGGIKRIREDVTTINHRFDPQLRAVAATFPFHVSVPSRAFIRHFSSTRCTMVMGAATTLHINTDRCSWLTKYKANEIRRR